MEKNEKTEKPKWVELIDALPEATRQSIGNLAVSTIQNLAVIGLISADLFDAVVSEATGCHDEGIFD